MRKIKVIIYKKAGYNLQTSRLQFTKLEVTIYKLIRLHFTKKGYNLQKMVTSRKISGDNLQSSGYNLQKIRLQFTTLRLQ